MEVVADLLHCGPESFCVEWLGNGHPGFTGGEVDRRLADPFLLGEHALHPRRTGGAGHAFHLELEGRARGGGHGWRPLRHRATV